MPLDILHIGTSDKDHSSDVFSLVHIVVTQSPLPGVGFSGAGIV